jgi:putative transposase
LIDKENLKISISRQCELLGIPRSSLYYKPTETCEEDAQIMHEIDMIYTQSPFYGRRRITQHLNKVIGIEVNVKRVKRLMHTMGIHAVYPKKNLSIPNTAHKKYPYLLSGMNICQVNQVWSTDITYVKLRQGFAYLCAVMDWHSRYVLSWKLSNTMDTEFCLEVLNEALLHGIPDIFNTDQGSQFTSDKFTNRLLDYKIRISMDGKGRAFDNIFIERLWRSVKYENIYPQSYQTLADSREGLLKYFEFYNHTRLHQSLGYETPASIYFAKNNTGRCYEGLGNQLIRGGGDSYVLSH